MASIRVVVTVVGALLLGSYPATAQFSLNKLKKVTDTALDVKQEVDRFTFSEEEEIELGLAISRRIIARYGVVRDLEATRYLSLVGMAVTAGSGRAALPWQWIVLDSNSVNAFAAPGGYVHITRGALAVIESEGELAGVLAHEAAHIVRKHTLDGLQKSMGTELAQNQATFSVGSAFFEAVADKATGAVLAGFGRSEELEADEVGVEIANRVGYSALGLPHFLQTLDRLQSGGEGTSVLYRSHPETEERIEKLDKSIKKRALDSDAWLEERYAEAIAFEVAAAGTGEGAVEGARGVAGGSEPQQDENNDSEATDRETADSEPADAAEPEKKKSFSLAKLSNPFKTGQQQDDSAEVTGAGAGRAVGEETDEVASGPKEYEPLVIEISDEELRAFLEAGGLK